MCGEFKQMDVAKRWGLAKNLRLCFCCSSDGHLGQYSTGTRVSRLSSCRELHHKFLHSDQPHLPHGGNKTTTSHGASVKSEQQLPSTPKMKQEREMRQLGKNRFLQGGGQ